MATNRLRLALALAFPLVASNCAVISGCSYETRGVTEEARVTEDGEEIRGLWYPGS